MMRSGCCLFNQNAALIQDKGLIELILEKIDKLGLLPLESNCVLPGNNKDGYCNENESIFTSHPKFCNAKPKE